jgi:hypothetical protein
MPKLVWDQIGSRFYETGVEKGVLFVYGEDGYEDGVAWNGLISVSEKPSGAESNPLYADNIKYLNPLSNEEFGATIEAYTYPDELAACDGSAAYADGVIVTQQKRKSFAFSYVTRFGNDTDGSDHGYKIHIVYGAMATPSEKGYSTINDSPEAITFSWEVSTTPVPFANASGVEVEGYKPTAHIVIDSTKAASAKLATIEAMLWGDTGENAKSTLPMPSDLITIFG